VTGASGGYPSRMKPRTLLPVLLMFVLVTIPSSAEETPATPEPVVPVGRSIRLATWNLENLFDDVDDPEREDRVIGSRALTQKMANLASVLSEMGGKSVPEIVAVQEIETKALLEALGKKVHGETPFTAIVGHGNDVRGMGVGLLTTWTVHHSRIILDGEPFSRPILVARLTPPGREAPSLHVVVVHFKSMRQAKGEGPFDDDRRRLRQATLVRKIVDEIQKETPGAFVAVAGDFNAECGALCLTRGLGAAMDEDGVKASPEGALFDAMARVSPSARGTTHWSFNAPPAWRAWATLDHVLLTPSLLGKGALRLDLEAGPVKRGVYVPKWDKRPRKFRAPKGFEDTEGPTRAEVSLGVSDHFPVVVWLRLASR